MALNQFYIRSTYFNPEANGIDYVLSSHYTKYCYKLLENEEKSVKITYINKKNS